MIKIFTAISTSEIEEWLNNLQGVDYDSVKIKCDSCDNSTSGVQFTAWCRMLSITSHYIGVEKYIDPIKFAEWVSRCYTYVDGNKWDGDNDNSYTTEELYSMFQFIS